MATPTKLAYQEQATSGATPLSGAGATAQIFPAQSVAGPSATLPTVTAQGGGARNLCNYLTDLVINNTNTTSTVVQILDGTTVIWTAFVPSNATSTAAPFNFTTPLKGSPNTAMSIKQLSAGAIVWSAGGFVAGANL